MKKLMLFAMWLAASTAAVGVAWAGVSVVDSQVVDPPSAADLASRITGDGGVSGSQPTKAPLAQVGTSPDNQVDKVDNLDEGDGPTSSPVTQALATPSGTSPATASPPTPVPSSSSQATQPTPAPTTIPSPQSAPTTQPSTTGLPTATSPAASPPATAIPAPAATQTFTLIGGTAAISFSASGVEVLWATPNPGFDVKIEPESPGIKVEFRADHHRSRVDAWWSDGPQHSLREEPRD